LTDDVISKVNWPRVPESSLPSDETVEKVIREDLKDLSYLKLSKKVRKILKDSVIEDNLDHLKSEVFRLKHKLDYFERIESRRSKAEKEYYEALQPEEP